MPPLLTLLLYYPFAAVVFCRFSMLRWTSGLFAKLQCNFRLITSKWQFTTFLFAQFMPKHIRRFCLLPLCCWRDIDSCFSCKSMFSALCPLAQLGWSFLLWFFVVTVSVAIFSQSTFCDTRRQQILALEMRCFDWNRRRCVEHCDLWYCCGCFDCIDQTSEDDADF